MVDALAAADARKNVALLVLPILRNDYFDMFNGLIEDWYTQELGYNYATLLAEAFTGTFESRIPGAGAGMPGLMLAGGGPDNLLIYPVGPYLDANGISFETVSAEYHLFDSPAGYELVATTQSFTPSMELSVT